MSDLISRQAAIDAVGYYSLHSGDKLLFADKPLKELPSVQPEIIRCKDCKWLSMTTLGMEYACWHGAEKVWGETGEHKDHTVCQRIDSLYHYCSYGERRSE